MNIWKGKRGFTLLEVLIVVAIIIIIAAIATPRFTGVAEKGKEARAKGDLRVLQTAVESFILNVNELPTSANVATKLEGADPNIVSDYAAFADPFASGTAAQAYNYNSSTSGGKKLYFFASRGKDASFQAAFSGANVNCASPACDDVVVTNAKLTST